MPGARSPRVGVACVWLACAPACAAFAGPLEFAYGSHALQRLDLYLPRAEPLPAPVVLLLHGGGWAAGDKCAAADPAPDSGCAFPSAILAGLRRDLVARGYVVAAANYRLAPEAAAGADGARFPAAVDDVRAALAWIRGPEGLANGCQPLVAVVGESAGANLGAMLAVSGEPLLAFVGYGGHYDLTQPGLHPAVALRVHDYLGCDPRNCPRLARAASPYWLARRATTAFPPMLLLHGTADAFIPPDQALGLRATNPSGTTLMLLRGYPHSGPSYARGPVTSNVYELLDSALRLVQPPVRQRLPAHLH